MLFTEVFASRTASMEAHYSVDLRPGTAFATPGRSVYPDCHTFGVGGPANCGVPGLTRCLNRENQILSPHATAG